jgi:hypothetical protein
MRADQDFKLILMRLPWLNVALKLAKQMIIS